MTRCVVVRYPLAVKLGTITPNGADVYSYAPEEDSMVKVGEKTPTRRNMTLVYLNPSLPRFPSQGVKGTEV